MKLLTFEETKELVGRYPDGHVMLLMAAALDVVDARLELEAAEAKLARLQKAILGSEDKCKVRHDC